MRRSFAGELLKNGQQRLRSQCAIRADHLHVFIFQECGASEWTHVAESGAFFGVGELRNDGQAGKRADRFDGQQDFLDVGKRFEDEEIDAALFERQRLFVKNGQDLIRLRMARLHTDAERTDRAGNQNFARGGFARFAGNFHAAAVQALHFVAKAERCELEAIRAEGVGLDDLRAGFDVRLMHAKDRFGLGGVQLIEAALRAHRFVQHRTHGAIGDEDGIFQPLVEVLNFHGSIFLCSIRAGRFSAFVP